MKSHLSLALRAAWHRWGWGGAVLLLLLAGCWPMAVQTPPQAVVTAAPIATLPPTPSLRSPVPTRAMPTPAPAGNATPRLLIPLYSCPSDQGGAIWREVAQAGRQVPITIIWGIICEEDDYQGALRRLGAAGVQRLAYIATSDSQRPLTEIEDKIAFYRQYPGEGFFFDEVNPEEARRAYNAAVIARARRGHPETIVVLNAPYASPLFVARTAADAVVIFENTWEDWLAFQNAPYSRITPQRMAVLIHTTPAEAFPRAMSLVQERHVGWFYVTDRDWDALPSYFWQEVVRFALLWP